MAREPPRPGAALIRPAASARPLGRHNPRVARLHRLVRRKEADLTVVDGRRLVRDLARSGVPVLELYGDSDGWRAVADVAELAPLFARDAVFELDREVVARLAPTTHTQGVLAVVPVAPRPVAAGGIAVYLDCVQDPGNVGSIVRTAAAVGAAGVALSAGCADPFAPRTVRSSAGQSLLLPIATDAVFDELVTRFRMSGGEVVAAVGDGGTPVGRWRPRLPVLLVLGSEGRGISPEVEERCDARVSIPIASGVESLNVAVAAGILLAYVSGVVISPILEG